MALCISVYQTYFTLTILSYSVNNKIQFLLYIVHTFMDNFEHLNNLKYQCRFKMLYASYITWFTARHNCNWTFNKYRWLSNNESPNQSRKFILSIYQDTEEEGDYTHFKCCLKYDNIHYFVVFISYL